MAKEIEIPEGYEAKIDGNKVVFVPKESEDEKMRKFLLNYFIFYKNHPDLYIIPNKWQGVNTSDIIDWLEKQKEQKPTFDDYLKATPAERRKMSMTEILEKEKQPKMIQWTGKNLKEVIDFTGKSPRFDEWFKSWEEFENYVHSHGDILKLFCEDDSHFEVPVGAWIVKTPDGFNTPSIFKFVQKSPEWSKEDEFFRQQLIVYCENCVQDTLAAKCVAWLKSLSSQSHWKPSEEQMKALKIVARGFPANDPDAIDSLLTDLQKLL